MHAKNKRAFHCACLLFILLASWNFTQLFLRQNNTLFKSGEWRSLKAETDYPVMAAYAFMITRRGLPFDSLDLGVWHGLNEVVSKRSFNAKSVEFRLFLQPESHLSFQFDRNPHGYRGFTFSANQQIKSKYFVADDSGVFSEVTELSFPLKTGSWNNVYLEFGDQQSKLFVNGRLVGSFPSGTGPQSFGFRGPASSGTLVDDISVHQRDGTVWTEDFSNRRSRPTVFLFVFFVLSVLFLALGLAYAKLEERGRQLRLTGLSLGACILAITLNQADKIYFARFYIQLGSAVAALQQDTVNEMFSFNPRNQDKSFIYGNLKQDYFKTESKGKFKILFLGSSQTWGSGARHAQDTISEKFGMYLRERIPNKEFEVFNGAVPGEVTKDQFNNFLELAEDFPRVVVLNMSVNDNRSLDDFKEYLLRFIALSRKENFRLILVPEPFYDEKQTISRDSQTLVETVGRESGVEVVQMQKYMEEKANSGFLWWDVVHLSSYGQDLLARKLADQLHAAIRKDIVTFEKNRRAGPWRQN